MAQEESDSMDLATETLVVSARLLEQLPETERNSSFGKALNYIVSGGLSGLTYWVKRGTCNTFIKAKEALDAMRNIIDLGQNNQRFTDALEYHQKNSTFIGDIDYGRHFGCSAQELKNKISQCSDAMSMETCFKNAINDVKTKMADKIITKSTKMASVLIVVQIVKLYFVWKEISKAQNLHNDTTTFENINQNIEDFKTMCDQLVEAMQSENVQQTKKIMRRATTKYNKTKTLISNLRVKINGSLQKLDLYADMQVLDGISNFASTVGYFSQMRDVFDSISSHGALVISLVVGAFALITIANGVTYCITQKRLDELRKDMQQLSVYETELDRLYEQVENAEDWIDNR